MRFPRSFHRGVCLAFAICAVASCTKAKRDDVLARVGDREIRIEDFNAELAARQQGNPVPIDPKVLLDELILRERYAQMARKAGLESDREVQRQIRDVLIAKMKERSLTPKLAEATVTEAEVQSAYESRCAEFATPERARLAVLFLQAPAGDAPAIRQRLEAARNQAQAGSLAQPVSLADSRGFGALAATNSEDQETRYRGGDIGWVERARHPQRIDAAAIEAGFALKEPGSLSEVIRGERGYYLVKLIERQPASVAPLDQVAPAIHAGLLRAKQERIEADFLAEVQAAVPVETHLERLPTSRATSVPAEKLPPKLP